MPISAGLASQLSRELHELRRRREALSICIQHIEALLASRACVDTRHRAQPRPRIRGSGDGMKKPARGSLRRRIVEIVGSSSGIGGREVFEVLSDEKFTVGGKASLRERVAHELSRLRRRGVLTRSRDGRFALSKRLQLVASESVNGQTAVEEKESTPDTA